MKKGCRTALLIISILAQIVVLNGCTQNDGDLHGLFGSWKLESITIDNVEDKDYQMNEIWVFQNNIMAINVVDEHEHLPQTYYGTFERDGNTMTMNFTHSDNAFAPGTGPYAPPTETHLPAAIFNMEILKLTGSKLRFEYINTEGKTIIYNLKKWG